MGFRGRGGRGPSQEEEEEEEAPRGLGHCPPTGRADAGTALGPRVQEAEPGRAADGQAGGRGLPAPGEWLASGVRDRWPPCEQQEEEEEGNGGPGQRRLLPPGPTLAQVRAGARHTRPLPGVSSGEAGCCLRTQERERVINGVRGPAGGRQHARPGQHCVQVVTWPQAGQALRSCAPVCGTPSVRIGKAVVLISLTSRMCACGCGHQHASCPWSGSGWLLCRAEAHASRR